MNNQEIITKIEEWVDDNEDDVEDLYTGRDFLAVESRSLITFIKKLLHE